MKRLYLNHFFKEKGNKEPVVAVENRGLVYANRADIFYKGRKVASLVTGKITGHAGHEVRAWVETECEVEVK